jgi:intron-binding protein aquarius
MELLIDLESQLPTRRYVNSLLHDLNLLTIIQRSRLYDDEESALFRDLYTLLRHYMHFPVDDSTGVQLSQTESYEIHCAELAKLQRTALKYFREKLTILALSNYGSVDDPKELKSQVSGLNDAELERFSQLLGFRTEYPELDTDRAFLVDVIAEAYGRRITFQDSVRKLSILPTEVSAPIIR